MAIYKRMLRPVLIPPALQGCSCSPDPIGEWYSERDINNEMIEEWEKQVKNKDAWGTLAFQEEYKLVAGKRKEIKLC